MTPHYNIKLTRRTNIPKSYSPTRTPKLLTTITPHQTITLTLHCQTKPEKNTTLNRTKSQPPTINTMPPQITLSNKHQLTTKRTTVVRHQSIPQCQTKPKTSNPKS